MITSKENQDSLNIQKRSKGGAKSGSKMSEGQTSPFRIHSSYIQIVFDKVLITNEKVKMKMQTFDHVFIFVTETTKMNVILFKPSRFDIRTDEYIRKHFKIGVGLPTVFGITKKKAFEFVNDHAVDDWFYSKGIFKERTSEYTSQREIERLNQELEKKNITVNNTHITNVIIPKIYTGVKINPLGQENLSSYGLEDFLSILNDGRDTSVSDAMRRLITTIHFDSRNPENQNIHITQRPDNFPTCIVYLDGGWCLDKPLDHVMNTLCTTNMRFMKQIWEDNVDSFPSEKIIDSRNVYNAMKESSTDCLKRETARTLYSLTKTSIASEPFTRPQIQTAY